MIRLTGAEESSNYRALAGGTATTWADVSLAGFIHDNARLALLFCRVSATGTNGKAQVRVLGSQTTGLSVGYAVAGGTDQYHSLWQRVTSDMKIQYQVTAGASLTIFVLGYSMTEPS